MMIRGIVLQILTADISAYSLFLPHRMALTDVCNLCRHSACMFYNTCARETVTQGWLWRNARADNRRELRKIT